MTEASPKRNWFGIVMVATVVLAVPIAIFIGTFAATLVAGIGLILGYLLRDKTAPAKPSGTTDGTP